MKTLQEKIQEGMLKNAAEKVIAWSNKMADGMANFVVASILLHLIREKLGIKDNFISFMGGWFDGDAQLSRIAATKEFAEMIDRLAKDEELIELAKHKDEEGFTKEFGDVLFMKLTPEDHHVIERALEKVYDVTK